MLLFFVGLKKTFIEKDLDTSVSLSLIVVVVGTS